MRLASNGKTSPFDKFVQWSTLGFIPISLSCNFRFHAAQKDGRTQRVPQSSQCHASGLVRAETPWASLALLMCIIQTHEQPNNKQHLLLERTDAVLPGRSNYNILCCCSELGAGIAVPMEEQSGSYNPVPGIHTILSCAEGRIQLDKGVNWLASCLIDCCIGLCRECAVEDVFLFFLGCSWRRSRFLVVPRVLMRRAWLKPSPRVRRAFSRWPGEELANRSAAVSVEHLPHWEGGGRWPMCHGYTVRIDVPVGETQARRRRHAGEKNRTWPTRVWIVGNGASCGLFTHDTLHILGLGLVKSLPGGPFCWPVFSVEMV